MNIFSDFAVSVVIALVLVYAKTIRLLIGRCIFSKKVYRTFPVEQLSATRQSRPH